MGKAETGASELKAISEVVEINGFISTRGFRTGVGFAERGRSAGADVRDNDVDREV